MYLPIKYKFLVALTAAFLWMAGSFWVSQPWYHDLSQEIGVIPAYFVITFIAIIPGFMNAFVAAALLLDRRPKVMVDQRYPPVTVLIAAYN